MLFTATARKIRVMLTPFRDGLQSSFGGKVRLKDILPAMEYAAKGAGIRHFEFGGGAPRGGRGGCAGDRRLIRGRLRRIPIIRFTGR